MNRPPADETRTTWTRRAVLKTLTAIGVTSTLFGRALGALAESGGKVTPAMIAQAEWVSGVTYTDEERELMLNGVNETLGQLDALRAVELGNDVPPALYFESSIAGGKWDGAGGASDGAGTSDVTGARDENGAGAETGAREGVDAGDKRAVKRPAADEDIAFLSIAQLGRLLRARQISSVELTRIYLERLRRFDPTLHCVITLTEERALEEAARADRELAAGRDRGPLHGIPWGAKDLIAVPGYRTTWGAAPYRDRVRDETATVVSRLGEAGAVLVAKLAVGALAWGDVWFDAKTRNPWNVEQGSSGSSAGPAAATAAGLVGFTLGTETWGSIVSPCTRCGASGLRPTFGRVSRHGVMALSWSMDKIGPITRSAEDCALVFDVLHGADGLDLSAIDRPFTWPPARDPRTLRLGYVRSMFEEDRAAEVDETEDSPEEVEAERRRLREWAKFDQRTLNDLRAAGFDLIPIDLPTTYPVDALQIILTAEAATAFDELTRTNRDDLLARQTEYAWPNVFRQGQLVPAVEYIRANRIRTLVMRELEEALSSVDVFVAPSFGGNHLLMTNLTGHPAVVVPNGFRSSDGTPTSITFTGHLWREADVLAVARAYQSATKYHRERPRIEVGG